MVNRGRHEARAALCALALAASPALAAKPSPAECIAANERAIALRDGHRLLAARAELLACASPDCPDEVREECVRSIAEVNQSVPTIVFDAKDEGGNDVAKVRVLVDGRLLVDELAGVAVEVDPGAHAFRFEAPHRAPVEKRLVVLEGVKAVRQGIVFGAEQREEPGRSGATRRLLGWTAVGAGAIGVGIGVAFTLMRSSRLDDARSVCPGDVCPASYGDRQIADAQARSNLMTREANTDGTVAVVGFVAGALLAGGGLALLFTSKAPAAPTTGLVVAPAITPRYQGFALRWHL